jgi:hypothetical protein
MYRTCFHALILAAVPLTLVGCGPSKGEMEKEAKKMIEEQLHVKVKSLTLNKESGNKYSGTAEATNGDKFDVYVTVSGRKYEIKAQPDEASVKQQFQKLIEEKIRFKVTSINLVRQADHSYTGEATLANGQKLKLTAQWEGNQFRLKAQP